MKTIIIDDNKDAAHYLAEHLEKYKDTSVVGIAYNGFDGLIMVSEHQPDLIFLDVQLPDISGLDFLDRVDVFTHGRCRVVMYTAYAEFVLPAFRKKAFDVLLKPIDEKELATVMDRLRSEAGGSDGNKVMRDGKKNDDKFLLYTNTIDFRLVDKRDVCLFQYNHEVRCWEAVVAGCKAPVRLKRTLKSDELLRFDSQFVQVSQRCIVNMNYLIEVVDNVCHFYPPFEALTHIKVGRFYRRKLIDRFSSL